MIPLVAALAIGAGGGAAIGGLSTMIQSQEAQAKIRQQQKLAQQAYENQRGYRNAEFNLQRNQAMETLGGRQNQLAQALRMDVAGFNLGMESQALSNQAAQISLSDNIGMAQAAQGMSGTRDSDSTRRNINYQKTTLARQMDIQGRSNSLSMQNMAARYSNQWDDIGREIDSWYTGYRAQAKDLSDVYADQTYGLQMREYQNALDDAAATPLDYLTGILDGAAQGASFASQIHGMFMQEQSAKAAKDTAAAAQTTARISEGGNTYGAENSRPAAMPTPVSETLPTPNISLEEPSLFEFGVNGLSATPPLVGTQAWADSLGLPAGTMEVDRNGYWHRKDTDSWNFRGLGNVKFVEGPGVR